MASCKDFEECRYIFFSEQPLRVTGTNGTCHLHKKSCGYSIKGKPYFDGDDINGTIKCLDFSGGQVMEEKVEVSGSVYYRQEKGNWI